MNALHWYAIYTRSRHEKVVLAQLQRKGIETFLPVREVLSQWKDRKRKIELPLFTGYVFARVDMAQRRLDILKVPGVARIVGFNNHPEPIPDEQLDAVQKLVQTTIKYDPYPYVGVGQRVEVRRGALAGIRGILIRKTNQFKFILSVDLVRQSVGLEIDGSDVEPVD